MRPIETSPPYPTGPDTGTASQRHPRPDKRHQGQPIPTVQTLHILGIPYHYDVATKDTERLPQLRRPDLHFSK